jgi:FHA domain-containing protein
MTPVRPSTFIIIRDDLGVDPKNFVSEAVTIGREPDAQIWLNHPNVSLLHAGIKQIEGDYYLTNLDASTPTILNGRAIPFEDAEVLIAGDEVQIGPFFLRIKKIEADTQTVTIVVRVQFALGVSERKPVHKLEAYEKQRAKKKITAPLKLPPNSLRLFWSSRTGEKAGRPTPLHPRSVRSGKARYHWMPTRDLIRPWPFSIFIWAAIVIVALSGIAAFAHKIAFAPNAISDPHTRKTFALTAGAIAKQSSNGACFSCHVMGVVANKAKVNAKCEACHQTETFVATIISAHREAGLTCTTCHGEHRGKHFRPIKEALEKCIKCHIAPHKTTYNDKNVPIPYEGTYGYPVVNGVWVWKGLDEEELAQKPELVAFLNRNRADASQEQQWRNVQFHGLHVDRVRLVPGIEDALGVDGVNGVLSCRSCHKSRYMGANVNRDYPRTTCVRCHNTQVSKEASILPGVVAPSCTSCHVQHVKDTHWTSPLLVSQSERPDVNAGK